MDALASELARVFMKGIEASPDSPLARALSGLKNDKAPKDEANYRPSEDPAESCGNCRHFDGKKRCNLVEGEIHPDDTCDWFER